MLPLWPATLLVPSIAFLNLIDILLHPLNPLPVTTVPAPRPAIPIPGCANSHPPSQSRLRCAGLCAHTLPCALAVSVPITVFALAIAVALELGLELKPGFNPAVATQARVTRARRRASPRPHGEELFTAGVVPWERAGPHDTCPHCAPRAAHPGNAHGERSLELQRLEW